MLQEHYELYQSGKNGKAFRALKHDLFSDAGWGFLLMMVVFGFMFAGMTYDKFHSIAVSIACLLGLPSLQLIPNRLYYLFSNDGKKFRRYRKVKRLPEDKALTDDVLLHGIVQIYELTLCWQHRVEGWNLYVQSVKEGLLERREKYDQILLIEELLRVGRKSIRIAWLLKNIRDHRMNAVTVAPSSNHLKGVCDELDEIQRSLSALLKAQSEVDFHLDELGVTQAGVLPVTASLSAVVSTM